MMEKVEIGLNKPDGIDSESREIIEKGSPVSVGLIEAVFDIPSEDGSSGQSVTIINLEQCNICSAFYGQGLKRPMPQPKLNWLFCKLLDIRPDSGPNGGPSVLSKYIPICSECTQKLQSYEKLRLEMEVLRNDVLSSVVDTLVNIRPTDNTPIHTLKDNILKRWPIINVGTSEVIVTSITTNPELRKVTIIKADSDTCNTQQTRIEKLSSSSSPDDEEGDIGDGTLRQWVYKIVDPGLDKNPISLTVAEDVTLSTPDEILEFQNNNDCGDESEDEDCSRKNNQKRVKEVNSKDKVLKNAKNQKDKNSLNNKRKLENPPPYFCNDCGRVFGKLATSRLHAKNCTSNDSGRTKVCPLCSMDFSSGSWQTLKEHFDSVHPNSEVEKCVTCRMDFLPTTLKSHTCGFKAVDYANLEADFKCDICSKAYITRVSLTDHIRRAHKDAKKWSCKSCNKIYSSKMLLEEHTKMHGREKTRFKCSVCGTYSTSAWGLKQHERIHTGELPFQCNICNKAFRCASVLRNHTVTHTKQKNFSCEICGKSFGLQGTMTRHWKRHQLPDSTFTKKCPLCPDARFKRVWVLKEHMIKYHINSNEYESVMKKYKDVDDRPKTKRNCTVSNIVENNESEVKIEEQVGEAVETAKNESHKLPNDVVGKSEDSPISVTNKQGGRGKKREKKRTIGKIKTKSSKIKSTSDKIRKTKSAHVKLSEIVSSSNNLRVSPRQTKKPTYFIDC